MQMLVDARFDRVDDWWSGGRDTMNDIIAAGKCDELESLAEATFGYMADNGEYPTVTDVNDWLWFERDSIYSELGIGDAEKYLSCAKEMMDGMAGYLDGKFDKKEADNGADKQ